ncbi:MAG: alpha/beta fold hydrolase [Gemmatimonadetes bacterium]|nr:alpha/beta hydrolase [Gemmatimonadota bacterium]NIR76890.1 alpha/beta hydrolase [Gemmatimonadota bacterium]NIT85411.1 alpha/beta hydrolase [Gemmatimonadota bacterium]NIU29232.1 alpha/beta hydrolase [Gemmatimonadota bacterium]NIU34318.1 alpha/beta fold hydrolase [Gemmatimonadota bacterium]
MTMTTSTQRPDASRRRRKGTIRAGLPTLALAFLVPAGAVPSGAQANPDRVPRILEQDSTLNNLVDPPGYETGRLGKLGRVRTSGYGPGSMILIPGLGFGGDVFEPLTERWSERFTLHAVTLPGFGGTPAPPSPPSGTSFGEQTWTDGALTGLERLMEREGLDDVVVVGHWLTGTQLALRLAAAHPDRVSAVVLLAGSARWTSPDPSVPVEIPLENRVARVDRGLAPKWFRTVTRETWDDNNFLPQDYAANPVLGLRHWREAARPPLHVWVRYLCEFFAQDVTLDLDGLEVPTLLLHPGLEGAYVEPGANYLGAYTRRSWGRVAEDHPMIRARTIPDTRVILWADRPDAVAEAVKAFLDESSQG